MKHPNRGVVLSLADAYAIHRWLELLMDDRRFFNPIVAVEAKRAAEAAKQRLNAKLMLRSDPVVTAGREPSGAK